MASFKLLNKIFPTSPDFLLKKSKSSEASLAKLAHVNAVINDISDIAKYDLDVDATYILPINTNKGIIDIINFDLIAVPLPGFATSYQIVLTNNPVLNLANKENLYIQLTPYYSAGLGDLFVPYVVPTGATVDGLNITIYNANPAADLGSNGTGDFYLYYEIKSLG
ncbi:MAG: hypothetical protein WCK31_01555 [bacterium]